MPAARPKWKWKWRMAVLDRRHLDIGVLVDHPGAGVVPKEHLGQRQRAAAVVDPDLGADAEILDRGLDQILGSRRTIDIDRLGPVLAPRCRHQVPKARGMVVVMMGDENRPDVADVDAGLDQPTGDAVAGIDHVKRSVDDQQIGRLRSVGSRRRTAHRSERDQTGSCFRRSRIASAPCFRARGETRLTPSSAANSSDDCFCMIFSR